MLFMMKVQLILCKGHVLAVLCKKPLLAQNPEDPLCCPHSLSCCLLRVVRGVDAALLCVAFCAWMSGCCDTSI